MGESVSCQPARAGGLAGRTKRRYKIGMPKYERHIFVCCNRRAAGHPRGCCADRGAGEIRAALKAALAAHGLAGRVRANEAGCLDQCEHGPTLVVYPDEVWYGFVGVNDVEEIVQEHILAGRPVERLRLAESCLNNPRCPHRASE